MMVIPSQEKEISSKIVLRMSPRRVMETTAGNSGKTHLLARTRWRVVS
jgi:hypothetical protein